MSCAVKDCYSNVCPQRDSTITFHRFPKACHKVWQKLAGLSPDNWKWQPNQKMCSMHFEENCFIRTGQTVRLRKDAMPTLLLPNNHVQEGEQSNPHLKPQSITLSKPKAISAENIDYSISNFNEIKSTKNSGRMEKSVPVSSNVLGYSSLSTVVTNTSTSEPDIKTGPLSMEIKEEHEVDFASRNILPEISVKSLLKSHANDIKTEIDITDYSISNIVTVKTEPTMEVESDKSAMSCDGSITTIKSETSVIPDETCDDSDKQTGTMVPIKEEPTDCFSISRNDDLKSEQNTNNIEEMICKMCQTYFTDSISLEHHLKDCYRSVCGQIFTSNDTINKNILPHEELKSDCLNTIERFGCSVCKNTYRWQKSLMNHRCINVTEKNHKCSQCSKEFAFNSVLRVHERSHTGEKPYECSHCSKRFTRLYHLNSHKLTHTGEKPYECSQCSKRFMQKSKLTIHERTHTAEKPHECSHCSKRFTTLSNLNSHKLTHTGEKAYQCLHCSKCFNHKSQLTIHERYHTAEKSYECSHCSKRFIQKMLLTIHERSHTGEKPYECSHCSKRFSRLDKLKSHKLTHTGEKAYECSHCSKRFTQLGNLNRHKLIHTGEKPYECSRCSKRFVQKNKLTIHERTHTD